MEVAPVTAKRWGDLVDLFERKGPRGGTPMTDGCWCMWWRQRTGNRERNKQAMKELVDGGREPGLLAYESAVPVGWVSIGPREEFGQLVRSRIYRPVDEEPGAWSIVCFYVHPSAKRHRVATALLGAAVEHALTRGARAIEAYPRDQPDYMGVKTSLERLGFEAARPASGRSCAAPFVRRGASNRLLLGSR